ncbi:MAG TPA: hypothetical protein VLT90_11285, partial [Terriglobales bacterium]|nr:hypothetical protein [Terriglobales bacterium]
TRKSTFSQPQAIEYSTSPVPARQVARLPGNAVLPSLILDSGEKAWRRYLEFFAAHIRNPNTRAAYAHAVGRFCRWCQKRGIRDLHEVSPFVVAAYVEHLK